MTTSAWTEDFEDEGPMPAGHVRLVIAARDEADPYSVLAEAIRTASGRLRDSTFLLLLTLVSDGPPNKLWMHRRLWGNVERLPMADVIADRGAAAWFPDSSRSHGAFAGLATVASDGLAAVLRNIASGARDAVFLGPASAVEDEHLLRRLYDTGFRDRTHATERTALSVVALEHDLTLLQPHGAFDDAVFYVQLPLPRDQAALAIPALSHAGTASVVWKPDGVAAPRTEREGT